MTTFINRLTQFCNLIEKILYWVLFFLFCSLITIVFLQVIARYILSNPWLWTVDLSVFCLIWSTFLGAAICVRHNTHFIIDLWPSNKVKTIMVLTIIATLITIGISTFYLFYGWEYAISSKTSLAGMTSISMLYFLLSIPVGSILMVLFSFEALLSQIFANAKGENTI